MNILVLFLVVFICFVGLILYGIIAMSSATKGKMIEPYENPQKAVLVVDVQEDFTGKAGKSPYKDSDQLITTVNTVVDGAAGKDIRIVFILNEFESFINKTISRLLFKGATLKGDPGTNIDERIAIKSGFSFSKQRADAFSNPELDAHLAAYHVNELYLVGLDAAGCIDRTAKGALNRGYKVNIITDGIVTRFEKKFESLLQQWKKDGIALMSSQEFLKNANP